eukprot:13868601-Ditylum_brightwellii.AAC.1
MPTLTPKLPASIQKTQQSTVLCLYRHQQDTIVPLSPPPWQCCAIINGWCHSPGPKIRKSHQQYRGSALHAKSQHATLPLCVIDALGEQYLWGRWWGRHGRGNGTKK